MKRGGCLKQDQKGLEYCSVSRPSVALSQASGTSSLEGRSGLSGLELVLSELKPGFTGLRPGIRNLKSGLRGFKSDLRGFKSGLKGLKSGFRGLKPGLMSLFFTTFFISSNFRYLSGDCHTD